MYKLDSNSKVPLHIQLYEELKKEITNNLKVKDKLPSIRKVASLYNISKTTVESAYSQLYAEGYIESKPKVGYFVSDLVEIPFKGTNSLESKEPKEEYIYDFSPTAHHKSYFPKKIWRRVSNQVLLDIDFSRYIDGRGDIGLREAIAKYLINSRGVRAKTSNIVVTSRFIDALRLVASLLKPYIKEFAIESPGYYITQNIFSEYGYDIKNIPLESNSINLEALEKSLAKLVYVTPSHQYPTGGVMPISKRQKLLNYINSINGYIIEDDYDSELNYTSRPIPALAGLDERNRVIYVGTFAKALSPAIRVTYLHLPDSILELYLNSYDSHFSSVNIATQKTLEKFIKDGYFERHLRKIRTLNRKKHNLMLESLKRELKQDFKLLSKGAGLAILIYPTKAFDWQKFHKLLREERVKVYLASMCNLGGFEAIRLGFGSFDLEEIPKAVKKFSTIFKSSIID